jgi:hypothetical protein
MTQALREGWAKVDVALRTAKGIAFDGCHKIYVLMDDEQMRLMAEYGYGEDNDYLLWIDQLDAGNPDRSPASLQRAAARMLVDWYEESCGLRFISAVETNTEDPNEGFTHLIAQFDDDPEDDPDIYGWGSYDGPNDDDDEEDYR